jgi:neutral ceramidase
LPPEPLPLGGYTERGSKVFLFGPGTDPADLATAGRALRAWVQVISGASTRVAIVSVPLLTIPESLHREVKKRLPEDLKLFLLATHTHSAPDSQMLNERMTLGIPGIANYRPRWLQWYADKIAGGVQQALHSETKQTGFVEVRTTSLGLNRGRRAGAWPDQVATSVTYESVGSGPLPLFLHYTAHPVILGAENMIPNGDWAGGVANLLQCPVLNGAIGDVSPAVAGETAEKRLSAFVRALIDVPKESSRESITAFAWATTQIDLGKVTAHPDFAKRNRIPNALAQSIVKQFAPSEGSITALRLGKLAVVGVPGEPTSHLGRQIRDYGRRIGFKYVLVCSHVNGWIGYILDPMDYDRGGYEATLSFYGREEGNKVVAAAKKALTELARPSKTGTKPIALRQAPS